MTISPKQLLSHAVVAVLAILLFLAISIRVDERAANSIVVTLDKQLELSSGFARTWQRAPTDAELRRLMDDHIRDEIAYREGQRLELGSDDVIVRRRMREQLESMVEQAEDNVEPTKEELQSFLTEHSGDFRVDSIIAFRQIYFNVDENAIGADAAARFTLGNLQNQEMPDDVSELGDWSLVPASFDGISDAEISALFGSEFAARIAEIPLKQWSGPVRSNAGLHLIYIDARDAGRAATLDEVEDAVRRELQSAKRTKAIDDLYHDLAQHYRIEINGG